MGTVDINTVFKAMGMDDITSKKWVNIREEHLGLNQGEKEDGKRQRRTANKNDKTRGVCCHGNQDKRI